MNGPIKFTSKMHVIIIHNSFIQVILSLRKFNFRLPFVSSRVVPQRISECVITRQLGTVETLLHVGNVLQIIVSYLRKWVLSLCVTLYPNGIAAIPPLWDTRRHTGVDMMRHTAL